MEKDKLTQYFFIGTMLLLTYLTFLIVKPFLTYLVLGAILTYFAYPLFERINKKITNKMIASSVMIIIILLVLIIPSIFITKTLISQATGAIDSVEALSLESGKDYFTKIGVEESQVNEKLTDLLNTVANFIIKSTSKILGSVTEVFMGVFVLFFVMYYGFKEGPVLYKALEEHIPIKAHHRHKLLSEVKNMTNAIIYGQVLTAIVQGGIGGIGFLIFGIPNAVFWGFIMILFSFVPVIGPPIIWIPAGLIQLAQGDYVSGVGILIYGAILVTNIDNFLKPRLISSRANIHPVVVLIGVLGGLTVFGFTGIVLGPLVMALLITMVKFYTEEKSFSI